MKTNHLIMLLLIAFGYGIPVHSQQKKNLTSDDYKKWERLSGQTISPDGSWIAWRIQPEEGNDSLYLKNFKTDSLYKDAFGSGLIFSHDSRWAAWRVGVSRKTEEEMQEKKQPVHAKMALLDLVTGKKTMYKEVSSFAFPKEGTTLAMMMYPPKDFKGKGNDLVVLDPLTGRARNIGNVSGYSFNKSGELLACIIQPANDLGNSVELYHLSRSTIRILASDTLPYSSLLWTREGNSLAFLHQIKNKDYTEENYEIVACRNILKEVGLETFSPLAFNGFPGKMRIQGSGLRWAEDESSLFFGIQDWTKIERKERKESLKGEGSKESKESKEGKEGKEGKDSVGGDRKSVAGKPEKQPGLDIWHWQDPVIQPQQKLQYNREKNESLLCMWNLTQSRFLQIADSVYKDASLSGNQKFAWIYSGEKYEPQFRLTYNDYYKVDLTTGKKDPLLTRFTGFLSPSPEGQYILFFRDNHWWTHQLATGREVNLTGNLQVPFWNVRDDHPAEVRPSYGSGGWLKDDKLVLLYDEYDVWAVKPDGSGAEKITDGRNQEIIHRVMRLEYENDFFDPKEILYFTLTGDKTKKSGYARMKWGSKPEVLLFEERSISGLTKAKKSDDYLFTAMTYEESPSLLLTDQTFRKRVLVASSNRQQSDFAWGKAELVNFRNKSGQDLQGVLHYPAGYEPGKKYPMLVYIYEIRSNSLHSYINPSDKSSYNVTNYVQQGFFVFQPDIVYRLDDPGISAVECVVPAVEKVLSTGMIDRSKIGLMGHSWGAYQTAFIITQTDLFSAAVAGAPLTDMISMYTEVYWNSGTPNQQIFETSQGRFTRPYWEILDNYMANSPMFQAQKIKTPILVTFGDSDGAVDWHQGIELYTTMRRMQKPMVMLVYAGENHGLAKKENMLDYTKRINDWFDHYLLQKEAPEWITKGLPYLEKMKKQEPVKEGN